MYESNGDPHAHNPNGENSWGLAQINLPYHSTMTVATATNPITALTYAYKLYRARPDWGDWYNSNVKYNNNYQGIAAQSRAIYGNGIQDTASVQPNTIDEVFDVGNIATVDVPDATNPNTVFAIQAGAVLFGVFLLVRVLKG